MAILEHVAKQPHSSAGSNGPQAGATWTAEFPSNAPSAPYRESGIKAGDLGKIEPSSADDGGRSIAGLGRP